MSECRSRQAVDGGARVLGIGEILWDLFPDGSRLGGAPFNVTANLRRLGHPATFATAVGDDPLGREAVASVRHLGVGTELIAAADILPTGTVVVALGADGSPSFDIVTPAAYEALVLDREAIEAVVAWAPRALVFGTLAQRFRAVRETTRRLVEAINFEERLYDVNLRDGCWSAELVRELLPLATIVKLNAEEARAVAAILDCPATPEAIGERLARDHGTRATCVTNGGEGASLWLDGSLHTVAGLPVAVVDAVGAGDAFAAGLLHGLLEGEDGPSVLDFANRLGALVASRPGALPHWRPDEIGADGGQRSSR